MIEKGFFLSILFVGSITYEHKLFSFLNQDKSNPQKGVLTKISCKVHNSKYT